MSKIKMICKVCKSTNVQRDAWAEWDVEAQEWVLGAVFDAANCEDCEDETTILEVDQDA